MSNTALVKAPGGGLTTPSTPARSAPIPPPRPTALSADKLPMAQQPRTSGPLAYQKGEPARLDKDGKITKAWTNWWASNAQAFAKQKKADREVRQAEVQRQIAEPTAEERGAELRGQELVNDLMGRYNQFYLNALSDWEPYPDEKRNVMARDAAMRGAAGKMLEIPEYAQADRDVMTLLQQAPFLFIQGDPETAQHYVNEAYRIAEEMANIYSGFLEQYLALWE